MKTIPSDLDNFIGSEVVYRHWLGPKYTEGIRYLADQVGAYWLIDEIFFAQRRRQVRAEPFQHWQLMVDGSRATLSCEDGNGNEVWSKRILLTDFPPPGIHLYCVDNHVLMLPSEY